MPDMEKEEIIIDSWEERVRMMLDGFREVNVREACRDSEKYAQLVQREEETYAKLGALGLTEEQRAVIEEAYEAQSAADAEYAAECYMCGIADCLRFSEYMKGKWKK